MNQVSNSLYFSRDFADEATRSSSGNWSGSSSARTSLESDLTSGIKADLIVHHRQDVEEEKQGKSRPYLETDFDIEESATKTQEEPLSSITSPTSGVLPHLASPNESIDQDSFVSE